MDEFEIDDVINTLVKYREDIRECLDEGVTDEEFEELIRDIFRV